MKNTRSFWSWQGNNLDWPSYTKWITLGIIMILLVIIYFCRNKLRAKFASDKKVLWFKNMDNFLVFVGIVGIIYQFAKMGLYMAGGYPLYWEHLMLHMCRIHFLAMMFMLAIRKKEWIKYIAFLAIGTAIFGFMFGNQAKGSIVGTKLQAFNKHGLDFYGVGADNFFFYDFFIFHIIIIILPVIFWVGNRWKLSTLDFYKVLVVYSGVAIIIWFTNWMTGEYAPLEWKMNNWYMGIDKVNEQKNALGPLSNWPFNLLSFSFFGLLMAHVFQLAAIGLSKDRKQEWKDFKDGYKTLFKSKKKQK